MIEEVARRCGVSVHVADAAFEEGLARLPLAQKRCASNKAFVWVGHDAVTKGPYAGGSLKLLNNLRYPHLIGLLEEQLGLPEAYRGAYQWRSLHAVGGRYYLRGENVGNPAGMVVVSASSAVDASFRVVERETLLRRVSEVEKVKVGGEYRRHPAFDVQVAVASLQHLYLRHLFNVGDSGTHNILLREDRATSGRLIAGIDFDEHRRDGAGATVWDCLFKKGHAYLETLYGALLGRVVQAEGLGPAVRAAAEELNQLGEPVDVEAVTRRQERLRGLMSGGGGVALDGPGGRD